MAKRPSRAITTIKIDNNTTNPLLIERIKIPVPNLNLFIAEDGNFWTESMKFQMENESNVARVKIYEKPHDLAGKVNVASSPRVKTDKNILMRTFGSIF